MIIFRVKAFAKGYSDLWGKKHMRCSKKKLKIYLFEERPVMNIPNTFIYIIKGTIRSINLKSKQFYNHTCLKIAKKLKKRICNW